MRIYSADLETTVYDNQTYTEAWASALVSLDSDTPLVFHSLEETLEYLDQQDEDARFPYHGSGAMTRSPTPLAWRPDFPGAPREAH